MIFKEIWFVNLQFYFILQLQVFKLQSQILFEMFTFNLFSKLFHFLELDILNLIIIFPNSINNFPIFFYKGNNKFKKSPLNGIATLAKCVPSLPFL